MTKRTPEQLRKEHLERVAEMSASSNPIESALARIVELEQAVAHMKPLYCAALFINEQLKTNWIQALATAMRKMKSKKVNSVVLTR